MGLRVGISCRKAKKVSTPKPEVTLSTKKIYNSNSSYQQFTIFSRLNK